MALQLRTQAPRPPPPASSEGRASCRAPWAASARTPLSEALKAPSAHCPPSPLPTTSYDCHRPQFLLGHMSSSHPHHTCFFCSDSAASRIVSLLPESGWLPDAPQQGRSFPRPVPQPLARSLTIASRSATRTSLTIASRSATRSFAHHLPPSALCSATSQAPTGNPPGTDTQP